MNRNKPGISCLLTGILLTVLVLPVFAGGGREAGERISLDDAREMVAAGDAFFVDVRDQASYLNQHISGAIFVPFGDVARRAEELSADGRSIITYCACPAEETSRAAAADLIAAGVTDVYVLEGGIAGWAQAGLPLKSGSSP